MFLHILGYLNKTLTTEQPAGKVFKIHNLSDVDATLLEPASCAAHGLDKISPKLGSSVLMFGAGPTGLVLAQMLRQVLSLSRPSFYEAYSDSYTNCFILERWMPRCRCCS